MEGLLLPKEVKEKARGRQDFKYKGSINSLINNIDQTVY